MPAPNDRLRLQLLQLPTLRLDDGDHLLSRKDAALLALLALAGPTPRARVAALLWPDADDETARNNLRQRIFRLRRRARGEVVEQGAVLTLAEGLVHDLLSLEETLARDPGHAEGELLGAFEYGDNNALRDWVDAARQQWRAMRREALTKIALRLEHDERIADALAYAERLARDEPLLEHAQRQLMRLHYRRGDRGAALAVYERLKDALDAALGETPSAETRQLAGLIEAAVSLPVAPVPRSVAVLRPPRLVGREREWAWLGATCGHGGGVLVSGEPGIGKSRLLEDFAAARALRVVVRARPGDSEVPHALLARIVRAVIAAQGAAWAPPDWVREELARIVPELGTAPLGELVSARLRQAAEAAMASVPDEAFVVDDIQFGDPASLAWLAALLASAPATCWLLAARHGPLPPALGEWLDASRGPALQRLSLGPLDAAAVARLLESLQLPGQDPVALAPALHRHTGGNPLFVLETLCMLLDTQAGATTATADAADPPSLPVPASLERLVLTRFDGLSKDAQRLARVAALAGQDFDVALAAQVLGVHPIDLSSPWAELEAAQVMRDGLFVHDLLAETLSRAIPAALARTLHASIAELLQRRGGEPARVAAHWQAAGNDASAGAAYAEAAMRARRASLRHEELAWLDRAQRCLAAGGRPEAAFRCAREAVRAAKLVRPIAEALARADALLDSARSDVERAAALEVRSAIHVDMQAHAPAFDDAQEGLARLGSGGGELRVLLAQRQAMALSQNGCQAQALAAIEAVLDRVDDIVDADARVELLIDYGTLLDHANRRREAVDALQRAHRIALQHDCLAGAANALNSLAICSFYLGRVHDAAQHAEQARSLGPRLGSDEGSMLIDGLSVAAAYLDLGRFGEALTLYERCVEGLRRAGHVAWAANAENNLACLYAVLGQPQRGLRTFGELPPASPALAWVSRLFAQARLAQAMNRPAREMIEQAISLARQGIDRSYVQLRLESALARELAPTDGAALCEELLAQCLAQEHFGAAWPVLVTRTDCLRRLGDHDAAAASARQTVAFFDQAEPVNLTAAEVWWSVAQAFDGVGCVGDANEALRSGRTWLIDVALPHVPEAFRDSFLNRNPVHRELLQAATRRLELPPR